MVGNSYVRRGTILWVRVDDLAGHLSLNWRLKLLVRGRRNLGLAVLHDCVLLIVSFCVAAAPIPCLARLHVVNLA